jgi:hypothetical protein
MVFNATFNNHTTTTMTPLPLISSRRYLVEVGLFLSDIIWQNIVIKSNIQFLNVYS